MYMFIDYVHCIYTPHCRQHNTDNPPMLFPECYFSPSNNMPFMDKKRQTILLLNIITGTDSVCSTRVCVPSHRYIYIYIYTYNTRCIYILWIFRHMSIIWQYTLNAKEKNTSRYNQQTCRMTALKAIGGRQMFHFFRPQFRIDVLRFRVIYINIINRPVWPPIVYSSHHHQRPSNFRLL